MEDQAQNQDSTEIRFDLRSVCSEEEIEKFQKEAEKAGSTTLTDHFVNLTLRKETK